MANQKGIVTFVGRIGNVLSYYLHKKLVSRTIGKVDLEKMRTAPQYEETRKNQSEFKEATQAGQLFRKGLMHLTKGYTNYEYPIDVMKILLKTLRNDAIMPKGHKKINNGLRNAVAQLSFQKLHIFSKRETEFYSNNLVKRTSDQKAWRLNRNLLFGKGVPGDQMTVKIGYYHLDFEGRVANYEDALSIACHRSEKIDFSDFTLPKPSETNTPWTFIILQVWREGSFQDITGMTYMSVVDVVENEVLFNNIDDTNEPLLHKCGREMEVSHGLHELQTSASRGKDCVARKGHGMHGSIDSSKALTHGHGFYREELVMPLKLKKITELDYLWNCLIC